MPILDENACESSRRRRTRNSARLERLSVYALAGGLLFACDSILGVEDDRPSSRKRGGGGGAGPLGGEGGLSGSPNGESGAGAAAGGNGESGRGTGTGGEDTGGTDAGGSSGRGGRATGGNSGRGGSDAGSGGDDGGAGAGGEGASGGGTIGPTLNERCEVLGAHACTGANDQLVLACEVAEEPHSNAGEQIWTISHTCVSEMRCDRSTARCRAIHGACTNYVEPTCTSGGGLVDCEESLFDGVVRQCPFGCRDGACLLGSGNQLIVHTEEHPNSDGTRWPSDVPVCFVPGESTAAMQDLIRDEVESTWGRYGGVQFTGWGTCEEGAAGVIIEFLEDCRVRLGSQVTLGYPGDDEASHVGFCRTYRDARGDLKRMDQDEALTRFMARHQFGHVFGRVDEEAPGSVMVRGIEHPGAETIGFAPFDYSFFRMFYGGKHTHSLVTTSGRCLGLVDSHIEPTRCADEAPQWWIPALDSVFNFSDPDEDLCVGITEEGAVDVTICSDRHSEVSWKMGHAQWSLPGGCVAPRSYPPAPGDSLLVAKCAPVGDETQSWYFEVFEAVEGVGYATRIQFSDSGLCTTFPGGVSAGGMVPLLEPCGELGQVDQTFFVRLPGEIAFADEYTHLCLNWDLVGSEIYLWYCGFYSLKNNFVVSGAIESSNGLVLSVTPDDEDAVVRAVARTGAPGREQIFDWYF
jgi:hypothetical protein